MGKGKCVQNSRRRRVTCPSLSIQPSPDGYMLSAVQQGVRTIRSRWNDSEVAKWPIFAGAKGKLHSSATVQMTRKGKSRPKDQSSRSIAIAFVMNKIAS